MSRQRTQTTLEPVPDDIDDAAHARMDDGVFKFFEDVPFHPITLLATIMSTSEGNLDPKYEKNPNATALLQEHPSLADKLREAWYDNTFKARRNLSASPYCDDHTTSNADAEILRPVTNAVVQAYLKTDSRLDTISSTSLYVSLAYIFLGLLT